MPQSPIVELPKRLPLAIMPENRAEDTRYDARLVNCFLEKEKEGEIWIYERPGLLEDSRPPAAAVTGRGIYNWKGNIYSIFADKLYKDGVVQAGTVDTTKGVYRFSQSLGATPRLQMGNGVKAYNYDSGAGLVQITDADFPSAFVKGWAYLDGTTYVGTASGTLQGSDINDTTAWNPLNVLTAQVEPDGGVAVAKQLVYVVFFKQWSTEIFYDAANTSGSPLGAVQGAKVDYGCANEDSVQDVNGTLIWMSAAREAGRQFVAMNKLKAEVISTPAIDRLLQNADLTTVFSWQIKVGSHRFYVCTIKNENLTLAFDLTEKLWSQWTDKNGDYFPIVSSTFNSSLVALLQHETNGRIYKADMAYADDNGDLIQVDIYTPNFDAGTKRRKQMNMLEFVADQQVGSILQMRWNDNDYDPTRWSNFRRIDLSQRRPFTTDLGTFVRRAYNFRHHLPVRMPRISAVEMQLDLGTL